MSNSRKKQRKPSSISNGRPPTFKKLANSISSKTARSLIHTHHQLEKARAAATRNNDAVTAGHIQKQIDAHGGLAVYQQASLQGQAPTRGGDSSRVLLEWLKPHLPVESRNGRQRLRLLEVGALSSSNACSTSPWITATRIDLHSQEPSILTQDFMERPLPAGPSETFEIISLSLVLNYVADPLQRGEMLRRTCNFLSRDTGDFAVSSRSDKETLKPSLFLVLPAPCVTNSRYMNEESLSRLMQSLGYVLRRNKISRKMVYYLWSFEGQPSSGAETFAKTEINPGKKRNNFSIVLNSV